MKRCLTDEFLSYMEAEQRASPNTVEAYGRDLRQFAVWLSPTEKDAIDSPLAAAVQQDIRAWTGSLADNGMTATTLRRKVQSLRAFYHWAMKRGHLSSNPAADVVLAKKRRHLPDFIKESEVERLLEEPHESFAAERAHIALTLMYSLGLRQAELLALTDRDISRAAGEIRVTGKRGKQRVLPLPTELADEISRWQTIRPATRSPAYRPDAKARTPCATHSPQPWSTTAPTSMPSARCSDTNRCQPHRYTHT